MAYVKNCNPGKITMDLPKSSYIYEMPLFSFADIHGDMNLSLIFNYEMKYDNQDPFAIKEGYKLNIHKKLILEYYDAQNKIPVSLIEGNGKIVGIFGEDWPYSFHDGSQRFIRQTGLTNKPYVIESSDGSKEYYNSSGLIVSAVDKYGVEVLQYTYNASNGRLTSLTYRNEKMIQFAYSNNKLYRITYSGSGCSTTLTYPTTGITVNHYAGETFNLVLSNTMDFSATASGANYAVKVRKASDFSIVLSDYIAGQVVNSTTYEFYNPVAGCSSNEYVDITNHEGVKIRNQYWRNHLAYSYEVKGSDVQFIDNRFAGSVQINKTMDNPYSSGAFGPLNRLDGTQMTFRAKNAATNPISDQWVCQINADTDPDAEGCYVLTGWIKLVENGNPRIDIESIADGLGENVVNYQFPYHPGYDLDGKWKFFAYRIYANDKYVKVHLPTVTPLETKDFRLTFQKTHVINESDASKIAIMEYGLIPSNNTSAFVPLQDCEFVYNYTPSEGGAPQEINLSTHYTITFQDLLKHRLNTYPGEVYVNGCDEAYVFGSSGSFVARYTNPATKAVTNYNVNSCYLGIRQYVENKMVTTRIRDDMDSFLTYQVVNASGTVLDYKHYDKYMDVVEEKTDGVTTTYTRNNDLVTATAVTDGSNSYTRTTTYGTNSNGNPTITTKDEFGKSTLYTLDSIWGVVKSVSLPDGSVITDTYDDDMCAMTKRTFGSTSGRSNAFAYSNGNISTLETSSLSYDFTYTKDKLSAISKNDSRVEEHIHDGNSETESFYPSQSNSLYSTKAEYDMYGRLTSIDGVLANVYAIAPSFTSAGALNDSRDNKDAFMAKTTDEIRGEVARFTYDQHNRVLTTKEVTSSSNFATKVSKETFTYDDINRMTKDVCIYDQPNSKQVTSTISYAKAATDPLADQRVGAYNYTVKQSDTTIATAKTQNTFDNFKRVKKKVYTIAGKAYTKTLTYNKTRINKEADTAGITNTYTYDSLGRISKIVSGGKTTTYHYDTYGQLVREDNQALDVTFVYAYNSIGNLTSIKKYAYTLASTSSPSGSYTTTSFGYTADKLTTFGGATIAYNTMGCPTTYEGKTATWTRGKLSKLSSGTMSTGISNYTYTYNAFGQRIGKAYAYTPGKSSTAQLGQLLTSAKTYYYDHAGRLISEAISKTYHGTDGTSESIVFLYDESGIVGMVHTVGGTASTYYFHRNLLGDVVAIYDTSGNMVAKYLYDAWGNCTISSETTNTVVANANPIRYRGYYYDDDTGLYYLNARYYSPKWRRFISPDDTAYLDPETPNGLNLYCYCNNDPVNYADPSGYSAILITLGIMAIGGLIGAAVSATSSALVQLAINGEINRRSVGIAAASGFVSGAIAASPFGLPWQMIAGGIIGGASYVADCYVNDTAITLDGAILSIGMGAFSGWIGGPGANEKNVLTNSILQLQKTAAREARRANQVYAQKAIASMTSYVYNILATTTWGSSIRFAAGCGVANAATTGYSNNRLFPGWPSWSF